MDEARPGRAADPFPTRSRISNTNLTACSRSSSICFRCAVRPASSRGIGPPGLPGYKRVEKVAEVLTIQAAAASHRGQAVAALAIGTCMVIDHHTAPAPPATGRAQGRLNSRLRGVSFAAITGVRDHLRR